MMAVLSETKRPTEGVRHVQPLTTLYVKKNVIGTGTLYITESVLSWIADGEKGLTIPFLNIILHAVSRDTNIFPHECLYMHTDADLPFPTDSDGESEDSNEDDCIAADSSKTTELYLVPEDKASLSVIYQTMAECQALNPDPMADFSPDEDFYDEDEAEEVEETDQQMADLRITSNGNGVTNNGDVDMDPDCFEDAEEDLPDH